jgi:hypothetical protein
MIKFDGEIELNGVSFPKLPSFKGVAVWNYKKDVPWVYRRSVIKAGNKFCVAYVLPSMYHDGAYEWSELPEKYRQEGDYITV